MNADQEPILQFFYIVRCHVQLTATDEIVFAPVPFFAAVVFFSALKTPLCLHCSSFFLKLRSCTCSATLYLYSFSLLIFSVMVCWLCYSLFTFIIFI